MATHSSTLAWRIPQTEEPGGLQSTGSQSQTRLSNKIITTTFSLPLKPQLVLQPSIIFSIKKGLLLRMQKHPQHSPCTMHFFSTGLYVT